MASKKNINPEVTPEVTPVSLTYADHSKVNVVLSRDKATEYDAVLSVEPYTYAPSVFTRTDVNLTYGVKVTPANVHSKVITAFMTADISRGGKRSDKLARYFDKETGAYVITRFGNDPDRVRALLLSATVNGEYLFRVKTPAVVAKCREKVDRILVSRFTPIMGSVDDAVRAVEYAEAGAIDDIIKRLGDDPEQEI